MATMIYRGTSAISFITSWQSSISTGIYVKSRPGARALGVRLIWSDYGRAWLADR